MILICVSFLLLTNLHFHIDFFFYLTTLIFTMGFKMLTLYQGIFILLFKDDIICDNFLVLCLLLPTILNNRSHTFFLQQESLPPHLPQEGALVLACLLPAL